MSQFLSKDEVYVELLRWVEKEGIEMEIMNVREYEREHNIDLKWYKSQLWSVLTPNCVGDALNQGCSIHERSTTHLPRKPGV